MPAGVRAGSPWVVSAPNWCVGSIWTCLSLCVDGEPRESLASTNSQDSSEGRDSRGRTKQIKKGEAQTNRGNKR